MSPEASLPADVWEQIPPAAHAAVQPAAVVVMGRHTGDDAEGQGRVRLEGRASSVANVRLPQPPGDPVRNAGPGVVGEDVLRPLDEERFAACLWVGPSACRQTKADVRVRLAS
jgi:hypothetical protein